ncbi:MAG TPA: hypothetical protein VKE95_16380, partial [Burkholderiales bacterium]|nr:hypothetical protein [Burkholderiales bacterium]
RSAASVDALYDADPEAALKQIGALYPPSLTDQVERLRTLEKDLGQLRALQSGALNPSGGVLRYRGKELKPARLPQAIGELEAEIREVEERLCAHDRLCRSAHLVAARAVGNGWPEYLRGLLAALHYAEHTEANLRDAQGLLDNTYTVVTATRKVSNAGANRMVDSANNVYTVLAKIDAQRAQVSLDAALLEKLKAASWSEAVGELKLPPASRANIGEWLKYVDGWIGQFAGAAGALRTHALESLLLAEDKVAAAARDGVALEAAPEAARLPESFDLLLPGQERKRQTRLDWWARFQTAEGMVPAAARFAVAGGIVAAALGLGGAVGSATVTIYNGLARPVIIELNGEKLGVAAFGSARRELESNRKYRIDARSLDGQPIESFDADVRGRFASYVYSVAGAAALVEWTATYGKVEGRADRNLGAPRWITNSADMMFAEPPRSVQTSRGSAGTTREVLTGLGNSSPQHQLSLVSGEADQKRLIALHARWDQSDSPYIHEWLSIAMQMPEHRGVLGLRLKESPDDVIFLRAEQDSATGAERETVCARHRARAEAAPQSPDLQYLAVRCLPEKEKSQQFLSGYGKWPDHGWFAYAAGYSYAEAARWREAIKAMDLARAKVPSVVDNLNVDLMRIHRLQMNAAQFKALKSMLLAEPVAKSFRIEDLQQAREQKDAAAPLRPFIELAKKSDALRQLVTLESGEGLAGSDFAAYSELARGNLDKAMRLVQGNTERRVRLLRLAAASDGASRDLVSAALALNSDDGIDESTVWAALALAMREKRETAPYLAQVGKNPRERAEVVVRFLEALQRGQPPAATERLLDGVQPSLRGHGYSGGVVLLGEKAPRAWRDAANRLLFASERPYFN